MSDAPVLTQQVTLNPGCLGPQQLVWLPLESSRGVLGAEANTGNTRRRQEPQTTDFFCLPEHRCAASCSQISQVHS